MKKKSQLNHKGGGPEEVKQLLAQISGELVKLKGEITTNPPSDKDFLTNQGITREEALKFVQSLEDQLTKMQVNPSNPGTVQQLELLKNNIRLACDSLGISISIGTKDCDKLGEMSGNFANTELDTTIKELIQMQSKMENSSIELQQFMAELQQTDVQAQEALKLLQQKLDQLTQDSLAIRENITTLQTELGTGGESAEKMRLLKEEYDAKLRALKAEMTQKENELRQRLYELKSKQFRQESWNDKREAAANLRNKLMSIGAQILAPFNLPQPSPPTPAPPSPPTPAPPSPPTPAPPSPPTPAPPSPPTPAPPGPPTPAPSGPDEPDELESLNNDMINWTGNAANILKGNPIINQSLTNKSKSRAPRKLSTALEKLVSEAAPQGGGSINILQEKTNKIDALLANGEDLYKRASEIIPRYENKYLNGELNEKQIRLLTEFKETYDTYPFFVILLKFFITKIILKLNSDELSKISERDVDNIINYFNVNFPNTEDGINDFIDSINYEFNKDIVDIFQINLDINQIKDSNGNISYTYKTGQDVEYNTLYNEYLSLITSIKSKISQPPPPIPTPNSGTTLTEEEKQRELERQKQEEIEKQIKAAREKATKKAKGKKKTEDEVARAGKAAGDAAQKALAKQQDPKAAEAAAEAAAKAVLGGKQQQATEAAEAAANAAQAALNGDPPKSTTAAKAAAEAAAKAVLGGKHQQATEAAAAAANAADTDLNGNPRKSTTAAKAAAEAAAKAVLGGKQQQAAEAAEAAANAVDTALNGDPPKSTTAAAAAARTAADTVLNNASDDEEIRTAKAAKAAAAAANAAQRALNKKQKPHAVTAAAEAAANDILNGKSEAEAAITGENAGDAAQQSDFEDYESDFEDYEDEDEDYEDEDEDDGDVDEEEGGVDEEEGGVDEEEEGGIDEEEGVVEEEEGGVDEEEDVVEEDEQDEGERKGEFGNVNSVTNLYENLTQSGDLETTKKLLNEINDAIDKLQATSIANKREILQSMMGKIDDFRKTVFSGTDREIPELFDEISGKLKRKLELSEAPPNELQEKFDFFKRTMEKQGTDSLDRNVLLEELALIDESKLSSEQKTQLEKEKNAINNKFGLKVDEMVSQNIDKIETIKKRKMDESTLQTQQNVQSILDAAAKAKADAVIEIMMNNAQDDIKKLENIQAKHKETIAEITDESTILEKEYNLINSERDITTIEVKIQEELTKANTFKIKIESYLKGSLIEASKLSILNINEDSKKKILSELQDFRTQLTDKYLSKIITFIKSYKDKLTTIYPNIDNKGIEIEQTLDIDDIKSKPTNIISDISSVSIGCSDCYYALVRLNNVGIELGIEQVLSKYLRTKCTELNFTLNEQKCIIFQNLINSFNITTHALLNRPVIHKLNKLSEAEMIEIFTNTRDDRFKLYTKLSDIKSIEVNKLQITENLLQFIYLNIDDFLNTNDDQVASDLKAKLNNEKINKQIIEDTKFYDTVMKTICKQKEQCTEQDDNNYCSKCVFTPSKRLNISKFIMLLNEVITGTISPLITDGQLYTYTSRLTEKKQNMLTYYYVNIIRRLDLMDYLIKLIGTFEFKDNVLFLSSLNDIVSKKSRNTIITYVKMRNDETKPDQIDKFVEVHYNRRFKIRVNNDAQTNDMLNSLIVEYNDDDEEYYTKIDKKFTMSEYIKGLIEKTKEYRSINNNKLLYENEINRINISIQAILQDQSKLKENNIKYKTENDELHSRLSGEYKYDAKISKSKILIELNNKLEELNEELTELNGLNGLNNLDLDKLEGKLTELNELKDKLNSEITDLNNVEQTENTTKNIKSKTEEFTKNQNDIKKIEKEIALNRDIIITKKEIENLQILIKIDANDNEIEKIKNKFEQNKAEIKKLKEEGKKFASTLSNFDSIIDTFKNIQKVEAAGDGVNFSFEKYNRTYLFGKFSKVFLPNVSNKNIADNMIDVYETLKSGKLVFILGYGASGAGKTSSLIYYNKGEPGYKEGILIHLCNKFAIDDNYTELLVCSKEFYVDYKKRDDIMQNKDKGKNENLLDNPEVLRSPPDENTYLFFNFNDGNFKYNCIKDTSCKNVPSYLHRNYHQYRTVDATTDFGKDKTLGEVMIHLIDNDRLVKATTNNPNSSRSHTIIILKLSSNQPGKPEIKLVIGDFAGVENIFDCENPVIQKLFASIKRDGLTPEQKQEEKNTGKTPDTLPFYSSEITKNPDGSYSEDLLKGGADFSKSKELYTGCLEIIKSRQDVQYDFDKPVESIKQYKPDHPHFNEDGIQKFDAYFDFIVNDVFSNQKPNQKPIDILTKLSSEDIYTSFKDKQSNFNKNIDNFRNIKDSLQNPADFIKQMLDGNTEYLYLQEENLNKLIALESKIKQILNNYDIVTGSTKDKPDRYQKHSDISIITGMKGTGTNKIYSTMNKTLYKDCLNDDIYTLDSCSIDESAKRSLIALKDKGGKTQILGSKNILKLINGKEELQQNIYCLDNERAESTKKNYTDTLGFFSEKTGKDYIDNYKTDGICGEALDTWIRNNYSNKITLLKECNYTLEEINNNFTFNIAGKIIGIKYDNNTKNPLLDDVFKNAYNKLNDILSKCSLYITNIQDINKELNNGLIINKEYGYIDTIDTINKLIEIKFVSLNSKQLENILKTKLQTVKKIMNSAFKANITEDQLTNLSSLSKTINEKLSDEKLSEFTEAIKTTYKHVETLLLDYRCRLENAFNVCLHRQVEGYFINDSLMKVRKVIQKMLIEKTKSDPPISMVPNYLEICNPIYCNISDVNKQCWGIEEVRQDPYSCIFNELTKELGLSDSDLFKNLVMCIFCVFNISKGANNPPPIPYIDINKFKMIIKYHKIFDHKRRRDGSKVGTLEYYFDDITNRLKKYPKIAPSILQSPDYRQFEEYIRGVYTTSYNNYNNTTDISEKNEIFNNYFKYYHIEHTVKFIELFDNSNAISAIGTLEFVDKLSKFNMTDNICTPESWFNNNALEKFNKDYEAITSKYVPVMKAMEICNQLISSTSTQCYSTTKRGGTLKSKKKTMKKTKQSKKKQMTKQ